MAPKRIFESGTGSNSRRPLNIKNRRSDALRSCPANCNPTDDSDLTSPTPVVCVDSPSNGYIKTNRSGKKYASAVSAVPLKCIPPVDVKRDNNNSIPLNIDAEITDKENKNNVRKEDESWEHDLEKIEALIAEARSYLNDFDQPTPVEQEEKSEISDITHEEWSMSASSQCREVCVMDDLSLGKEKIPVRVMNGVDNDRPLKFTYITSTIYPSWFKRVDPVGCDCVNGCSDSRKCSCVKKNGGEIPYNEDGLIVKAKKSAVHECGPLCRCPPTCMNRVGQHGPRYRLELFKTEKKGWGVRSRDPIPSGGFICDYVGEFLRETEADERIGSDEYLFDIFRSRGGRAEGFSIDGAIFSNMGKFINHSCEPNLYAQKVMYDHGDERMPHIMFFATEDIAPLNEIFYDYNYKLGSVTDANGNVKIKPCHCGARKCSKRMY